MSGRDTLLKQCLKVQTDMSSLPADALHDEEAEELRRRVFEEDDAWIISDLIRQEPLLAWRLGLQMLRVGTNPQNTALAAAMVFEDLFRHDDADVGRALGNEIGTNVRLRHALATMNISRCTPKVRQILFEACLALTL